MSAYPAQMPSLSSALLLARTAAGQIGTAGRWPASGRRVAGVATQSRAGLGDTAGCGTMAVTNVTFANFTAGGGAAGNNSQPFYAFEPCGRCLQYQGGTTTLVSGLRFVQPGRPSLAFWSWGQQVWMCVCNPRRVLRPMAT